MHLINVAKIKNPNNLKVFWSKKTTLQEEFQDTKEVIRIRKSKNRQYSGHNKKDKRTNNVLQNIHIQLKIE
jgi:hypothetical protein